MKRLGLLLLAFASVGGALTLPALADEETITASVTPCTVAASVSDGSVSYGALEPGETKNTMAVSGSNPTGGADGTQTITNSGTCPADLSLKSSDADDTDTTAGGGPDLDWDLVTCMTVGTNTFGHQYEVNNVDATFNGSNFPVDNNTYAGGLAALPAAVGTARVDLGICMPSVIGDSSIHRITVTALLTAQ